MYNISLQSAREFADMYKKKLLETGYSANTVHPIAFDTMWTVAQVLNYTEEMRLQNHSKDADEFQDCAHLEGELVPLNEFTYSNAFMGCVMKNNYYKVNFTGVSVSLVSYEKNDSTLLVLKKGNIQSTRLAIPEDQNDCLSENFYIYHYGLPSQGPVVYGDDGTIIYTRIRLSQLRTTVDGKL